MLKNAKKLLFSEKENQINNLTIFRQYIGLKIPNTIIHSLMRPFRCPCSNKIHLTLRIIPIKHV